MSKFLVVKCPTCHLIQVYEWRAKSLRARRRCLRCKKAFHVDISRHIRYDTAQQAREQLLRRKELLKRKEYNNLDLQSDTEFTTS